MERILVQFQVFGEKITDKLLIKSLNETINTMEKEYKRRKHGKRN